VTVSYSKDFGRPGGAGGWAPQLQGEPCATGQVAFAGAGAGLVESVRGSENPLDERTECSRAPRRGVSHHVIPFMRPAQFNRKLTGFFDDAV
jgi:hypothetical protein